MASPIVQTSPCNAQLRSRSSPFKDLPKCHNCQASRNSSKCRFVGCRTIVNDGEKHHISFSYKDSLDPIYPQVFNRRLTPLDILSKKVACATVLLPVLLQEHVHRNRPHGICRSLEISERVTCDFCSITLFSQNWLCQKCGREVCPACYKEIQNRDMLFSLCCASIGDIHTPVDFLPVSRFDLHELEAAISSMTSTLHQQCSSTIYAAPSPSSSTVLNVPTLARTASVEHFRKFWAQGFPLVVTGLRSQLQCDWTPEYFIKRFGTQKVTLVDCETDSTQRSTVADFFHNLVAGKERKQILKLKDWPPTGHFRDEFPELFHAFMDAVPFGDFSRLDGALNMAAHFPSNGVAPDLGPKMYIAYGTVEDDHHHGSTKLHIDMTDAVNIMVWAPSEHEDCYALWRIFPREMSPLICEFLRARNCGALSDSEHHIHSQKTYLTPSLLDDLRAQYGISPFTVRQRVGEAIFIPSGCAHQVSNHCDAIKIACDFISIQNLQHTKRVSDELRQQRLACGAGDDILQFYTTIWHAWKSLTQEPLFSVAAGNSSARAMKQVLRRRAKNRALKLEQAVSERPYRPGHDFRCFFCPRMFHRAGLIDHIKSSHSEQVLLDKLINAESWLRKPQKVADSDFVEELRKTLSMDEMNLCIRIPVFND